MATDSALRPARLVVRGLLVVMLVVGFASAEAWPFTSFHLFSHSRRQVATEYVVVAIDPRGGETPMVFLDLPMEFHGTDLQIRHFDSWTQRDRDRACDAWLEAWRRHAAANGLGGVDAKYARIDRVFRDVADNVTVESEARYQCGSARPAESS